MIMPIKPKYCLSFFFIASLLVTSTTMAQTISVMSYNIRMDSPSDGDNRWEFRRESMTDLLNYYAPDFIGLQEVMDHQVHFIDSVLPNYAYFGLGRDDGKDLGERTPIFYDISCYVLLQEATFWLSETPDEVSRGWDAACNRTCAYGLFEHRKTKQHLWVFNTHFDHVGETARNKSAQLLLKTIEELVPSSEPVILMGDFNVTPDTKAIKALGSQLSDTYLTSENKPYGPSGTFNGFNPMVNLGKRIDYIFVKNIQSYSLSHIDDRRANNLWVSDHLPVLMKAEIAQDR